LGLSKIYAFNRFLVQALRQVTRIVGFNIGIMPYKKYVSVIFDRGSELSDPNKLLEGKGKQMRHIKIYKESDIEEKNVAHFIKESHSLK
jgi:hypothetical protein